MKKIIFFLLCTFLLVPSFVTAHTGLSSSNPSEGQVVSERLEQIVLTFATSIEVLSTMDLVKDGNVIPLEDIKVENKQLMGTIAKPLENGTYIIQWKIVGEDGHPIKGEINFNVEMAQNEAAEPTPDTPEETEEGQEDESQTDQTEESSENQNTASDTVENTDDQNNNDSSPTLFTVFIVLIVIVGIVLLLFTKKKKN